MSIDVSQSFDEITERSLPYAKGGSKCEDFVHLTQFWLGRMQVIPIFFPCHVYECSLCPLCVTSNNLLSVYDGSFYF